LAAVRESDSGIFLRAAACPAFLTVGMYVCLTMYLQADLSKRMLTSHKSP
jgi:hypothetical protein